MTLTVALVTIDYPPDPNPSGIGIYTKVLAHALAARGHRVHVLSRGDDGAGNDTVTEEESVTVHRLGPKRFPLPPRVTPLVALKIAVGAAGAEWRYRQRLARKLSELILNEGVELIEAADTAAEALFYRVTDHPQVPFIVRLHGPTGVLELFDRNTPEAVRRFIMAVERRFFLKATHLTAPSQVAKDLIARVMQLEPDTITVLPNPPTVPAHPNVQVTLDPNLVLYVGRLSETKGVQFLAQAIPQVLEVQPQATFLFVGSDAPTGQDYPSTQAYLESFLPPSARQAVTFSGQVPHEALGDYYARAALCVFPSLFDTFSYVCLEAMSFGKAIIGSSESGMRDLLAEGAGILYTPPETTPLADAIITLLKSPAQRQELGERARQRFLSHYTLEPVTRQTEAYYHSVLAAFQIAEP